MQYTSKDYEVLGKQVAHGRYVHRVTLYLAVVLALLAGALLGRYVFPASTMRIPSDVVEKRPLGDNASGSKAFDAGKQQLLQSILQHEEALRKNPNDVESWEHLGNLYFDAGEAEKAVKAYNRALELKPGNTSVLVDCGVMYRELRQYDKALDYFSQALEIDPEHRNALFNSGIILYYDLKRKDEGLAMWRKLIEIDPDVKTPSGEPLAKMIKSLS